MRVGTAIDGASALALTRRGVELGLATAAGLIGARLVWLSVAPEAAVSGLSAPPPVVFQAQGAGVAADVTRLTRENPFSEIEAGSVEAVDVLDAPETSLNLVLAGGRAVTSGDAGVAFIQTPDNKTRGYAVGDEILSGVVLEEIRFDRVILRRNGALESLLQRDEGAFLEIERSSESATGRSSESAAGAASASSPSAVEAAPVQTVDVSAEGASNLLASVALSAVRENGRITGYRIDPRGGGALHGGLRAGDIVRSIDGSSVQELGQRRLLESFGGAGSLNIVVERDGEPVELIIEVS